MKYWVIFVFVITTLFGGLCLGSIQTGRSYVFSNNTACYSGNSFRVDCENPYEVRKF